MTVCVPVFLCCFSVPSLNSRLDLCVKRVFCFAENCGRVLNWLFAGFLNTQIVAQTRPLVAEGTILETGWLFQCNAVAHLSLVGCCFFFLNMLFSSHFNVSPFFNTWFCFYVSRKCLWLCLSASYFSNQWEIYLNFF